MGRLARPSNPAQTAVPAPTNQGTPSTAAPASQPDTPAPVLQAPAAQSPAAVAPAATTPPASPVTNESTPDTRQNANGNGQATDGPQGRKLGNTSNALSLGANTYQFGTAIQEGDTKKAVVSGLGIAADSAGMAHDAGKALSTTAKVADAASDVKNVVGAVGKFGKFAEKLGPIGKAIAAGVVVVESGHAAYETEGGVGAKTAAFGDKATGSVLAIGTSIIGLGGTGNMLYDNAKDWVQGKSGRHSLSDMGWETLPGKVIELGHVSSQAVTIYAGEVAREAKMYGKDLENHKHLVDAQQIVAKEFSQELKERGLVTQSKDGSWKTKNGIELKTDINGNFLNLSSLDYTDRDVLAAYKSAMITKHDSVDGNMWSRNMSTYLGGMSREQSSQYRTLNAALTEIDDYQLRLESITKEKYAKPLKGEDAFAKLHTAFDGMQNAQWEALKANGQEIFILKAGNAAELAETLNKKVFGGDNEAAKAHGFKVGVDDKGNSYITADAESIRAMERHNQKDLYQQLNATAQNLNIEAPKKPTTSAEELVANATAVFVQKDAAGFNSMLQEAAKNSPEDAGKKFIEALSKNSPELANYVSSLNNDEKAKFIENAGREFKEIAKQLNSASGSNEEIVRPSVAQQSTTTPTSTTPPIVSTATPEPAPPTTQTPASPTFESGKSQNGSDSTVSKQILSQEGKFEDGFRKEMKTLLSDLEKGNGEKLDRNGNGKVDVEEIKARFDANGDGALDDKEQSMLVKAVNDSKRLRANMGLPESAVAAVAQIKRTLNGAGVAHIAHNENAVPHSGINVAVTQSPDKSFTV